MLIGALVAIWVKCGFGLRPLFGQSRYIGQPKDVIATLISNLWLCCLAGELPGWREELGFGAWGDHCSLGTCEESFISQTFKRIQ